jgi:hypothetical protein
MRRKFSSSKSLNFDSIYMAFASGEKCHDQRLFFIAELLQRLHNAIFPRAPAEALILPAQHLQPPATGGIWSIFPYILETVAYYLAP